jgi:hypothetical protein
MARYIGNPLTLGSFGRDGHCVRMTPAERARHLYVVGATRTGKSKLLEDCIRQDILAWPRSGCGMLVLDRHGSLNDNVLKWAAANDLSNWPIVPIDLRQSDWTVSYNPLRRRGAGQEESVVVGNFVRSILHAWGQSDSNATPRLAKWLEMTLYTLHTNGLTLAEALHVLVSPPSRRALVASIEDTIFRSVWDSAPLREPEFQEMVESTVSRVRKFLSRRVMRAALGQSDVSLDLSAALEEGQLIFATIATEGGKIDEEDASTFGSLLLSDLWMAAKARGKRDEGGVKPFYVFLDEFQEYVTPSMAETLDQASGFGLHMTFAHQFPSQLLKSEQGQQLYNSVMANCRSKVVFQVEHNQDLEDLTLMVYRQMVNVDKVKHEIRATKVLGHELKYMESYGSGTTATAGGGTSVTNTEGTSHTQATTWAHTDSTSEAFTESDGTSESTGIGVSLSESLTDGSTRSLSTSDGVTEGESDTDATNWGEGEGESSTLATGESSNHGLSRGKSVQRSDGTGTSRSQTVTFGPPDEQFQEELGEIEGEVVDGKDAGEFQRDWARSTAITQGESQTAVASSGSSATESQGEGTSTERSAARSATRSRGGSHAPGTNLARTRSEGDSQGASLARTRGTGISLAQQAGTSHSDSFTQGTSSADTHGGSDTHGTSAAISLARSASWTQGTSESTSWVPMLIPVYGTELSSVTFESVQNQLFQFAQFLAGQRERHCVVKLVNRPPVAVRTLDVKPARTTDEYAGEWVMAAVSLLPFSVPTDQALLRIAERHAAMSVGLLEVRGEPTTTGIPVVVKAPPAGGKGSGPAKRMRGA